MKTEILHKKLDRYIKGEAMPAEKNQIQNWLSCTQSSLFISEAEKETIRQQILHEIQCHTAYPLFYPKKEKPWWQKIAAAF